MEKKLASDIRDYWGEKMNTEAEKRRRKIDEQTTNDASHRQEVESYCDVSRWSVNIGEACDTCG